MLVVLERSGIMFFLLSDLCRYFHELGLEMHLQSMLVNISNRRNFSGAGFAPRRIAIPHLFREVFLWSELL